MSKEEAILLLKEKIKSKNLISHSLAVGAVMGKLADYFNQDKEKWEICGLLHDIDYEETKESPEKHSLVGSEMLKKIGLDEEICQAVFTHNEIHNIEPKGLMAKSLFCADPLTGLIVASALVLPSKKLSDLKLKSVMKKFKDKSFAKGANREIIAKSESYLDMGVEEFVSLGLEAMKEIAAEIGL